MTTLLQINASINDDNGQSSQLANQFVAAFRTRYPDAKIVVRNVATAEPVPHLNAERFGAFITKAEERSVEQHAVVAYSDRLIDELKKADVIVLGLAPEGVAYVSYNVYPAWGPVGGLRAMLRAEFLSKPAPRLKK